jgi:dTDP-4-dehydrorhamnose reductase
VTGDHVLITGGGGQLASDLELLLRQSSGFEVTVLSRERLDIADDGAVGEAFARLRPKIVLNCAAFHNVDVCEREVERAFAVNAIATKRLGERCAEAGARLVHMSTNYVFDGARSAPYAEDDVPSPRSVYALSKLAGEHAALAYAPHALVVRTAGLYGLHGSTSKGGNFVTRMLGRASTSEPIRMVADQRLSPTFTADLAGAIVEAVKARADGVLHLTSSGACSWLEFTRAIMRQARVEASLEPIKTVRRPDAADRPLNGVLARPRADALGLTPLPHWEDSLRDYMRRANLVAVRAA